MITKYKLFETLNRRGSKSLDEREFDKIRKDNCKNWTKAKTSLYRGQIDLGPYVYTDPRGTKRESIEDVNTHIEIMDNLPAWENYPKYSSSVIGTSELSNILSGYGKIYEIIPFDNCDIAVCPDENIWESFGGHGDEDPIRMTWLFLMDLHLNNIKDLNSLGYIESNLSKIQDTDRFLSKVSKYVKKEVSELTGKDCYSFINDYLFNPVVKGFSVVKYTEGFEIPEHKQIWTNGPVLLIHRELA